jgi:hypothetical protein
MSQKNTLFNYFTKSPAQSKVQSGSGVASSEANDNIVQKSNGGTPTSESKKLSKKETPKSDSKKNTKTATAVSERNKRKEGEGNWSVYIFRCNCRIIRYIDPY